MELVEYSLFIEEPSKYRYFINIKISRSWLEKIAALLMRSHTNQEQQIRETATLSMCYQQQIATSSTSKTVDSSRRKLLYQCAISIKLLHQEQYIAPGDNYFINALSSLDVSTLSIPRIVDSSGRQLLYIYQCAISIRYLLHQYQEQYSSSSWRQLLYQYLCAISIIVTSST